jgi:hypothetical protein
VDRREAGVAGCGAVAPVVVQMIQERANRRRVQVIDREAERRLVGLMRGEQQQQPDRVPVGGDGSGAGLQLPGQPFGEEALQQRRSGRRGHDPDPVAGKVPSVSGSSATIRASHAQWQLFA